MIFKNKHDVVETSLMTMEDVGARIDVQGLAATDLDNGRLVVKNAEGNYEYASDKTATVLYLTTTPEKMYDGEPIDYFYNMAGRKIRVVKIMEEDIFGTTAYDGEITDGEKLVVGGDGKLVVGDDGAIVFEVIEQRFLGNENGVIVKRIK